MEHEKSLVEDFGNFQLTIAGTTWGICGGGLRVLEAAKWNGRKQILERANRS